MGTTIWGSSSRAVIIKATMPPANATSSRSSGRGPSKVAPSMRDSQSDLWVVDSAISDWKLYSLNKKKYGTMTKKN
jgi:hypothetical protein